MFSLSPSRTNMEPLLPPKHIKHQHKKTLVLDLDETLVHSDWEPFNPSDIILSIEFENRIHDIHVLVRPGTVDFIKYMGELFEYADPLMDILDENQNCAFRLFREHCTFINEIYVKDLKRLNRNLKDVIIVDNSPLSFSFHPDNGLPILSWYNEQDDEELYKITPILEFLSTVNDVRKFIPKMVSNKTISYIAAHNTIDSYYSHQIKKRKPNMELLNDDSLQKQLNKSNSGTSTKLKKSFDNNDSNVINKERDINMKIISSSKQSSSKNAPSKNKNAFRNGNAVNVNKDININNSRSHKQNINRHNNHKHNNNNSINNNNNSNDNTFTMFKPQEQQMKMISHIGNPKMKATSFQPVTSSSTVITSTKHRPSTSSTSFTGSTHHKRQISLNVSKDKKFIMNPVIYRSPSSQAIVVSSSKTTTHKSGNMKISLNKQTPINGKYSSGFNIHAISLYGNKNARPKSSEHGNMSVQVQMKEFAPKTPKLQGSCQNRLMRSGVSGKQGGFMICDGSGGKRGIGIDEVFVKKRFSNTSRHIDNPNKINLIYNPWLAVVGNGKKG